MTPVGRGGAGLYDPSGEGRGCMTPVGRGGAV